MKEPVKYLHGLFLLVVSPGFEPRQTESKSVVLPLHHETTYRDSAFCADDMRCAPILALFLLIVKYEFGKLQEKGLKICLRIKIINIFRHIKKKILAIVSHIVIMEATQRSAIYKQPEECYSVIKKKGLKNENSLDSNCDA